MFVIFIIISCYTEKNSQIDDKRFVNNDQNNIITLEIENITQNISNINLWSRFGESNAIFKEISEIDTKKKNSDDIDENIKKILENSEEDLGYSKAISLDNENVFKMDMLMLLLFSEYKKSLNYIIFKKDCLEAFKSNLKTTFDASISNKKIFGEKYLLLLTLTDNFFSLVNSENRKDYYEEIINDSLFINLLDTFADLINNYLIKVENVEDIEDVITKKILIEKTNEIANKHVYIGGDNSISIESYKKVINTFYKYVDRFMPAQETNLIFLMRYLNKIYNKNKENKENKEKYYDFMLNKLDEELNKETKKNEKNYELIYKDKYYYLHNHETELFNILKLCIELDFVGKNNKVAKLFFREDLKKDVERYFFINNLADHCKEIIKRKLTKENKESPNWNKYIESQ
jgi:hypothetical protein